ncbi:hypothetical protein EYC80_001398 [Monilinia laxa]|uniref:Mid2 domain-containing protein n=1 Tax=Monilinia laxa TaxID=61186 RepID=A0A5N6K977_MONLA|nr:hypothetical protein EYC80_001398 [Monilinia laxa]
MYLPNSEKTSNLIYTNPSLDDKEWALTDANSPLTTIADSPYTVFGEVIPIWYQSSDVKAFSSAATMTSTPAAPSTSIITSNNSSDAIDPTTSDESYSGLSTGTKVAIAVSISILIIALAIGTAIHLIRKRKGNRSRIVFSAPMINNAIILPEHTKELGNERAVSKLFADHEDVGRGTVGDEEVGSNETLGERRENRVNVGVTELPA